MHVVTAGLSWAGAMGTCLCGTALPDPQILLVLGQRAAARALQPASNTTPSPQNPSQPYTLPGAPNLLGRQPPLTHILVTTILPRYGDTSATILGGIFHMK